MRLAHLILAHNHPEQLERLIRCLVYKNTDIYIHLDKKSNIANFQHLQQSGDVFFISDRIDITWANYSMVTATLNSIEEILKTGQNYSHINLLSGADYPLKDPKTIQDFLFANADKTFMRSRHIHTEWEESRSRFDLYSFGDYNFPFKHKIQTVLNKLLPNRKLPNSLEPYGFSQWFTMTPVCAKYVVDYLKAQPAVHRFFRMTWGVDELVFQTVLLNSDLKNSVVNDHLRFIKFKKAACNPETLTMAYKDAIINSNKFYARKFNPEIDAEILDYIDKIAKLK